MSSYSKINKVIQNKLNSKRKILSRQGSSDIYSPSDENSKKQHQQNIIKTPYIIMASSKEIQAVEKKLNEQGVEEEQLNPVTAMLIMATQLVGIDKITEKTLNEFLTRLKMMEAIGNVLIVDPEGQVRNHNEHELKLHMGLSTTAHRLDKRKFRNRISNWVETRAQEIKDSESASIINQEENNADTETGDSPKKNN